jgi:glutathione S-transferase
MSASIPTHDNEPLVLASHALCPYVQRAAIVLDEKGVAFRRRDIDLAAKPDWFLAVSPLGKTPVLLVHGAPIFESAVICEYLDECHVPRLHPTDALARARHRSWIEFGSQLLNGIGAFYSAPDPARLEAERAALAARFAQLEAVLGAGPFFAGEALSIVDATFAPVFRYFDVFDGLPRVRAWRKALASRPSVRRAVASRYPELLTRFLERRGSALSRRMAAAVA